MTTTNFLYVLKYFLCSLIWPVLSIDMHAALLTDIVTEWYITSLPFIQTKKNYQHIMFLKRHGAQSNSVWLYHHLGSDVDHTNVTSWCSMPKASLSTCQSCTGKIWTELTWSLMVDHSCDIMWWGDNRIPKRAYHRQISNTVGETTRADPNWPWGALSCIHVNNPGPSGLGLVNAIYLCLSL